MSMQRMFSCIVLCSLLFVSSVASGEGAQTIAGSSALSGLSETSQERQRGGLFFIAEDFSQMAILPSYTFGAPSGLVPGFGTVFVGVGGLVNGSSEPRIDGGMSVGGGFGNPIDAIGGYAAIEMGSISPSDGGEFDRGQLALGLGHTFADFGLGLSVGFVGLDLWHNSTQNEILDPSFYLAVSKLFANDIAPVILTAGAGNEAFGTVTEESDHDRKYEIQEFLAAAVYVLPQVSLVADYTSGVTTAGVSIVPLPRIPVVLGLAANDIFQQDDGINAMITLGFGYAF